MQKPKKCPHFLNFHTHRGTYSLFFLHSHIYAHHHTLFVQTSLGIQGVFQILATFLISSGLQTANADLMCDKGIETKLSRQKTEQHIDTRKKQKVLRQKYSRETVETSRQAETSQKSRVK